MKCPSCGYEEKYDAKVCSFCSALLQPDEEEAHGDQGEVRGLPPHSVEEMRKEKAAQQLLEQRRREDEAKEKAWDLPRNSLN